MTEGLIWTYEGRVGICVGFAVLGLLISVALTVVVFIRKAPNWHTQTNQMTGMVEEGLARWFVRFLAFFVGLPLLALVIVTGIEVTSLARENLPLTIGITVWLALMGVLIWAIRAHRKQSVEEVGVDILPAAPTVAVPQPGHFLPDNADQWPR